MDPITGHAYNPETEVYFQGKIVFALQGIKLRIENNHYNGPQFLEELGEADRRTGDRGGELEKRCIIMGRDKKDKEDLEATQERFDDGTFGFCQKPGCKKVIPFDRLDAIPQAKYCLSCQVLVGKTLIPRNVHVNRWR